MSFSGAPPAVSSPSSLSHFASMLSASPSKTRTIHHAALAEENIPAQSSASPVLRSPPALISPMSVPRAQAVNPLTTQPFEFYVGRQARSTTTTTTLPLQSAVLDMIELVLKTTMNTSDNILPPLKTAVQAALRLLQQFKSYGNNIADIEVVMQLVVGILVRVRADSVLHEDATATFMEFAQRLLSVVEGASRELRPLEVASGVRQILSVPFITTVLATVASTRAKVNNAIWDYRTSVATWTADVEAFHRISRNVEKLVISQPPALSVSFITCIPPPLPHVFHGREAEIALARDHILNHRPARIPILGVGGIGKTALALAILHDADIKAHFANQRLFLACDSAPDTDAIVNYLLSMLQLDVSRRDPWATLRMALNSTATLLVLDSFETVYTGRHHQKADLLLQHLAACPHLTLILTMCGASLPRSIMWSLSLSESTLQVLSPHSALSTFIDLVRRELSAREQGAMETLLARVDHMPLTIVLLAHLAAEGSSPLDLLPQWDKECAQLISGDPGQGRLTSLVVNSSPSGREIFPARRALSPSGPILQIDAFDNVYKGATITVTSTAQVDSGATAVILVGELQLGRHQAMLVALKVFPAVQSPTKEALLKRELSAARKFRHPRILPFIGISTYDLRTVLVSRYYPKGNLRMYLLHNPAADRHRLVLEVAEAVNFLHREVAMVHGDLKCDNVLVSDEDTAVLADFGLSTAIEKSEDDATTVTDIRKHNTLRFCAPELLLDDGVLQGGRRRSKTKETDVYAFGMLIVQAFTGRTPWNRMNDYAVMMAISTGRLHYRPDDPQTISAGFSDFFWSLCCSCWERDPDSRPSMHDIVIALVEERRRSQTEMQN